MSLTPNRAFRESFPFPANCVVDGISGNGSLAPVGGPTGVINLAGLPVNLQWKLAPRTSAQFAFQVENRDAPQDVVYPGQTVTTKVINFKIQDAAATAGVAATKVYGTTNTITATARAVGAAGNSINLQFVDPAANDQVLTVQASPGLIVVRYATGVAGAITSTPAQVAAAIAANAVATAQVSVVAGGTAAMAAIALAPLAGGVDAGIGTWADVASSNLVIQPGGVQYVNLTVRQYFRVVATGGGAGELILTGDVFAHELTRF
jgi:hypothetical protein